MEWDQIREDKYGPILLVQSLVPTAVCAQPQPELQELQIETEKAQKSIVQWEECLNKQAPNLADQAQDFPWFRRHLKAKCLWAELDLTQSFWPSISGLTPNRTAASNSDRHRNDPRSVPCWIGRMVHCTAGRARRAPLFSWRWGRRLRPTDCCGQARKSRSR